MEGKATMSVARTNDRYANDPVFFSDLLKNTREVVDPYGVTRMGKIKLLKFSNGAVGEMILYDEGSIEVRHVKGADFYLEDILATFLNDRDVAKMAKLYYQLGRKNPYSIRTRVGKSGCVDAYLNSVDPRTKMVTGLHAHLWMSCNQKISYVPAMYIGDFAELIWAIFETGQLSSHGTPAKYIKPYFADEIKTRVTALWI